MPACEDSKGNSVVKFFKHTFYLELSSACGHGYGTYWRFGMRASTDSSLHGGVAQRIWAEGLANPLGLRHSDDCGYLHR